MSSSSVTFPGLNEDVPRILPDDIVPEILIRDYAVYNMRVVGCCNGLCCIRVGSCFVLWNPSTRKHYTLPVVVEYMSSLNFGFGFDGSDGGYKLLHTPFWESDGALQELIPNVYNLKTNSWTVAHNFHFNDCARCSGAGVFVNGKLHWLASSSLTDIVSFDLESEVGGLMATPSHGPEEFDIIELRELGGSLCFIAHSPIIRIDFWVLKDSWVRLVSISSLTSPMEVELELKFIIWKFVKPLCISKEGGILFVYGSNFVIYEPSGNSRYPSICNLPKLEDPHDSMKRNLDVHVNVPSLVSPFPHGDLNA